MFLADVSDGGPSVSWCFLLQVQLRSLLQSSRELLSLGALCPKLLWQEYRRCQVCGNDFSLFYVHVIIIKMEHFICV